MATNATQTNLGDGGAATLATFNLPRDVALDSSGNLYIADRGNHRVRKVSPGTDEVIDGVRHGETVDGVYQVDPRDDIITTAAGNGNAGAGGDGGPAIGARLFGGPLRFDAAGRLHVSDGPNHVIRRLEVR